jgi:DNA-binding response OmpR family regulator
MFKILVVEDDNNLRKLMATVLRQNGYHPILASNGEDALDKIDIEHIDLIICDVMMPIIDGYELIKMLREANYSQPVLMVTAKETLEDKKKGFYVGTDDYMVKPVDMDEMILRVEALMRRSQINTEKKLQIGKTVLDWKKQTTKQANEYIELTNKEFALLFKLLSYPGQIFTRQQLMDEIWGRDSDTDERTVDVHIKRLRDKLIDNKDFSIVTIRGLGYKADKND